jgi:hypothetical protein
MTELVVSYGACYFNSVLVLGIQLTEVEIGVD